MENINPNCESCKSFAFKNQIISALLNAKNTNQGIQNYKQCLENDFRDFAREEDSLKEEAEAFIRLQEIQKKLELISSCPSLYKKTIITVGGGFSAGKSAFISSFFQKGETRLAEDVKVTTAIPTYVIDGEESGLIGCTNNGASADLTKIDPKIQSKMTHDFIKSFDFNLRSIMPFAVLQTKLNHLKNICFIDTPGYNSSDMAGSYAGEDVKIANDFLHNAEILLWLIGLDTNGTIPNSDLNFLKQLDLKEKKLYFVLNKADERLPSEVKAIMQEIASILDEEGFKYEGISAYSSAEQKEYAYHTLSLFDFLTKNNKKSKFHNKIVKELYDVKSMYRRAILKNIKEQEAISDTLHSLSLDLYQEGFEDLEHVIFQRIDKLQDCFDPSKYEENLEMLDEVIDKFKKAIDEVFASYLHIDFDEVEEEDVELDVDLKVYGYGENPDGVAHFRVGMMYRMAKLYKSAVEEFEKAVELGDIQSCSTLGDMYRFGHGVGKQYGSAIEMYELAIKRGADFCDPYFGLGWIYQCVEGYQDYAKAKEMYEKAIELGSGVSCNNLGNMYYNGNGVPQDYGKAKELYEAAIQKGYNQSDNPYFRLGWIYRNADGFKDYDKGRRMYEQAISRGSGVSYDNLAKSYYDGTYGLSQDYAKAKELFELGASMGNENCKKALQEKWFPS